jgi:hypothetical protein
MSFYRFNISLLVSASDKAEAEVRAQQAKSNLDEMMGYAPFTCELEIDYDSCEEDKDYNPEDEWYD